MEADHATDASETSSPHSKRYDLDKLVTGETSSPLVSSCDAER